MLDIEEEIGFEGELIYSTNLGYNMPPNYRADKNADIDLLSMS